MHKLYNLKFLFLHRSQFIDHVFLPQLRTDQDTDEKHANQLEGGYSADVELSSSASSDQENPDYYGNIPTMYYKTNI